MARGRARIRWNEVGWDGPQPRDEMTFAGEKDVPGRVIVYVGLRAVAVTPETSSAERKNRASEEDEGNEEEENESDSDGGGLRTITRRDESREGEGDDARTEARAR